MSYIRHLSAKLQDALHYALAACPSGYCPGIGESAFAGTGGDPAMKRSQYIRDAVAKVEECGLAIRKTWRVKDALDLAEFIDRAATELGIDAYHDELLPRVFTPVEQVVLQCALNCIELDDVEVAS